MVFSWLRNQRRMELLSKPFPGDWRKYLHDNVRHYEHLDPRRRTTVEQVVQVLVAEKSWVGGAGFNVTDEMKVTVAGQAAILVLGLDPPQPIASKRFSSTFLRTCAGSKTRPFMAR